MTNPKDEGKPKVKKKAKFEWKKVDNVNKAMTTLNPKKHSSRSSEPKHSKRRESVPVQLQSDGVAKPKILLRRNSCVMPNVIENPEVTSSPVKKSIKRDSEERRRSSVALLLQVCLYFFLPSWWPNSQSVRFVSGRSWVRSRAVFQTSCSGFPPWGSGLWE